MMIDNNGMRFTPNFYVRSWRTEKLKPNLKGNLKSVSLSILRGSKEKRRKNVYYTRSYPYFIKKLFLQLEPVIFQLKKQPFNYIKTHPRIQT